MDKRRLLKEGDLVIYIPYGKTGKKVKNLTPGREYIVERMSLSTNGEWISWMEVTNDRGLIFNYSTRNFTPSCADVTMDPMDLERDDRLHSAKKAEEFLADLRDL